MRSTLDWSARASCSTSAKPSRFVKVQTRPLAQAGAFLRWQSSSVSDLHRSLRHSSRALTGVVVNLEERVGIDAVFDKAGIEVLLDSCVGITESAADLLRVSPSD